ncbi:MAG TPA: hydrogenase maturation nickel metallochaperone HypA [Gemmatimonadaceae bacterium]|jgi:Zn finger protein HypA/HybF involved in hydrogenase expression
MHELGVATEICRIVEAHAGDGAPFVTSVAVVVGADAGIEPSSLEFCLEVMLRQPPFRRATPLIRTEPGDALRVDYLEVDDGRSSH